MKRGRRLNRRETYLLILAADFVLAGEWPWEDHAEPDKERAALERAVEVLKARLPEEPLEIMASGRPMPR